RRASAARRGRSGSAGPYRGAWPGTGRRNPGRGRARRRRDRAAPRPSPRRAGRPDIGGAARASSEGEEASPLGRRARRFVARRDGAQLLLDLLELAALPRLELVELPSPPLLEVLEHARPARVEARERFLDPADHAQGGDGGALAVRAVEDDTRAEVGEGDGVSAAAAVAFDRDVPLGGSGDGEAGGLDRSRRGGGWRLWRCGRLRGGCGGRGRRGWGRPFLLEARRRVVTDGQLGMQHAGSIEQQL